MAIRTDDPYQRAQAAWQRSARLRAGLAELIERTADVQAELRACAHTDRFTRWPEPRTTVPLVLIVDDFEDMRDVISDLLTMHDFVTVTAGGGREALSFFVTRPPDVAIVDLGMPDMDGFEVARALRARWPDLPIMAFSGYSGAELERRAREAGFSRVLVKTMASAVIVEAVEAALVRPRAAAGASARRR